MVRFAIILCALLAGCGPRTRGPSDWRGEPPLGLDADAMVLWRKALGGDARSGSRAVLVSRVGFRNLKRVRSWYAGEALRQYVRWADRPEAAHWAEGWLTADVGPHDLVLVRWPAERIRSDLRVLRDAIGFAVFDLGTGRKRVKVDLLPAVDAPIWLANLRLDPEADVRGVVERGQGIAEVYGAHFSGWRVTDGAKPLTVLFRNDNQVNVKLDGARRVCIEASCAEVSR